MTPGPDRRVGCHQAFMTLLVLLPGDQSHPPLSPRRIRPPRGRSPAALGGRPLRCILVSGNPGNPPP